MSRTVLVVLMGLALAGCWSDDDGKSEGLGERVGEGLAGFTEGVGRGIDKSLLANVELAPEVTELGLAKTTAKVSPLEQRLSVYMTSGRQCSVTFLARALNQDGAEIGRAKTSESFEREDGKYVSFDFNKEMDTALVEKYQIFLLPEEDAP